MSNYNGAVLTQIDSSPKFGLGDVIERPGGFKYKYVKFLDAVTYVGEYDATGAASVAMLCTYANAACTSVTNDRAGGSSLGQVPAGVPVGVPTQNTYGWIKVRGVATIGPTDGSVAINQKVIPHATTDGGLDSADGVIPEAGDALDNDTSTTSVPVMLRCA